MTTFRSLVKEAVEEWERFIASDTMHTQELVSVFASWCERAKHELEKREKDDRA